MSRFMIYIPPPNTRPNRNCESLCEVTMHDWRVTLTLVLHAWKSPAMFLRLAPTLVHDCLSLTIKPRWQRQVVPLQLLTSVSMMELSEAKRLRGRGLGLGNGALVLLMLVHSGNWKVASLIGLLGTETVTWGDGGGSWSTADCTRSGSGKLDKSSTLPGCNQITRGCWDAGPPDRRGARSTEQKKKKMFWDYENVYSLSNTKTIAKEIAALPWRQLRRNYDWIDRFVYHN